LKPAACSTKCASELCSIMSGSDGCGGGRRLRGGFGPCFIGARIRFSPHSRRRSLLPYIRSLLHYTHTNTHTHTHTHTQVKSLYPKALATSILANHCLALAQELLSAGNFKLARALLLVAEADLTMATGTHSPKKKPLSILTVLNIY
jgi:hypothetical protein